MGEDPEQTAELGPPMRMRRSWLNAIHCGCELPSIVAQSATPTRLVLQWRELAATMEAS